MDEEAVNSKEQGKTEFFLGTVTYWSWTDKTAKIRLDGQDTAMSKSYKTMCGMVNPGDRVIVMKHSGTYIVLGQLSNGSTFTTDRMNLIANPESDITLVSGTKYAQYGNIAMLYIRFTPKTAWSSQTKKIATLYQGRRPAIRADAQYWAGSGGYIEPDGSVYVNGSATSTTGVYAIYSTFVLA